MEVADIVFFVKLFDHVDGQLDAIVFYFLIISLKRERLSGWV